MDGSLGLMMFGCVIACAHPPAAPAVPYRAGDHKVVVLPAESAAYPAAAESATRFLGRTRVRGFDPPEVSSVSLEVAQLSIECVDASTDCYAAVGRSLAANQLLFAELEAGPSADQVRVIVTLFDVDATALRKRTRKVFATEQDAVYGMRGVVEEATRP